MTTSYQQYFGPNEFRFVSGGNSSYDENLNQVSKLMPNVEYTVHSRFSLPRTCAEGKKKKIKSVVLSYRVSSGKLAAMTPSLHKYAVSNNTIEHSSEIDLITPDPDIPNEKAVLVSSTNIRKMRSLIKSPEYETAPFAQTVFWSYTLKMSAVEKTLITIYGLEVNYETDESATGGTNSDGKMSEMLTKMRSEILSEMRSEMLSKVTEMKELKEVAEVKKEVAEVRAGLSEVNKEVGGLTDNLTKTKKEVGGLTNGISEIQKNVETVTIKLEELKKSTAIAKTEITPEKPERLEKAEKSAVAEAKDSSVKSSAFTFDVRKSGLTTMIDTTMGDVVVLLPDASYTVSAKFQVDADSSSRNSLIIKADPDIFINGLGLNPNREKKKCYVLKEATPGSYIKLTSFSGGWSVDSASEGWVAEDRK